MTTEHPNAILVRQFYEAFAARDFAAPRSRRSRRTIPICTRWTHSGQRRLISLREMCVHPNEAPLRPEEIEKLLNFQGYGNPRGEFWFLGMEEQGQGTELELRWRSSFDEVEDLMGVHHRWEQFNPGDKFNAERLIPTWATMSKIVRRLKGLSNWSDTEQVRRYQAERLGRLDGETFLTEILPFPAWNTRDWPANPCFETRAQYEKEVRPKRISMLRELHETYSPRYVFCYGTGNWAHHHDIFSDVSFEPILDGRVLLGRSRSSTIVLTPFFAYYLMTNDLIDGIARALEAPPCA